MDTALIGMCGAYCGDCSWKEKTGCAGCQACQGQMFWGECDKARCCMGKGFPHCGHCPEMPCEKLRALFADPEHGDNGGRQRNLENWKSGQWTFESLRPPPSGE